MENIQTGVDVLSQYLSDAVGENIEVNRVSFTIGDVSDTKITNEQYEVIKKALEDAGFEGSKVEYNSTFKQCSTYFYFQNYKVTVNVYFKDSKLAEVERLRQEKERIEKKLLELEGYAEDDLPFGKEVAVSEEV